MKVKYLKEKIEEALKQGKVTEDSEVIIVGEYGFGMETLSATTDKVAETDEEILEENIDAFVINVPTYLYESEDVGYCRMYMGMDVLDNELGGGWREYFEDKEDE